MKKILLLIFAASLSLALYAQEDSLYVGYGKKISKKESAVSADVVSGAKLRENDALNPLNTLYGMLPGLNVVQGENLPWNSNPELFIRGLGSFGGNDVLILVDGIEREASLVNCDEIESITVLRDAAATAVYGNRGADGVIAITTKRGSSDHLKVSADYTFGLMTPFRIPSMVGASDYASALNSALANDGLQPQYTQADLIAINSGSNPTVFPNVNWQKEIMKGTGHTNNVNLSLDGVKNNTKLFLYLNFNSYRGNLNNTGLNEGFNTQIEQTSLKARANIDTRLTRTTFIKIDIMGDLKQYQEPAAGSSLETMYNTPALAFPVYAPDGRFIVTNKFENPLRQKAGSGIVSILKRSLYADLTIDQKFDFVTPGLYAKVLVGYDNSANINDNKPVSYSWYQSDYLRDNAGNIYGTRLTPYGTDTGMEFVSYLSGQYMTTSIWAQAGYDRTFGAHHVDGAFIASWQRQKYNGQNNIYLYNDYIVNANYSFNKRAFVGFTGNFSGSARMVSGNKYTFYPAVSVAYITSTEPFTKVRASYGSSGSDRRLSYDMDRQFNGVGNSYIFSGTTSLSGLKEGDMASTDIMPERDNKANIGFEGLFFDRFSVQAEGYFNDRSNICVSAAGDYSSMVGLGMPMIFTGHAINYGAELSLGWKDRVGDFSYHVNANASLNRSKILEMAEEYHPFDYMYQTGCRISSIYGLTAAGFYTADDFTPDGSLKPGVVSTELIDPKELRPGDVKYVDRNNDGVINSYDYSYHDCTVPDVVLGLQFGLQYKHFGAEFTFNGSFGSVVETALPSIYRPLYNNDKSISQYAFENSWSQENPDARYPRLTTVSNAHNFASSTIWESRLDYFKLRNVYIWYSIEQPWMKKIKMSEMRVFLRGNNLFSVDSIKIMDPEYISNGYPSMRSFQVGLKCAF